MKSKTREIHERALATAEKFKLAEADLLCALQAVDENRVYSEFGCTSLYDYATTLLKLSESVAYNFIVVARKATQVPELKAAIQSGDLSVSKARKITSVLTSANQSHWLKLAIELPQRKLEQEVARVNPKAETPESIKFTTGDRLSLQMGLSEEICKKLKRAQDLESQRLRRAATLEETLDALLEVYLMRNDPVEKAERILIKRPRRHQQGPRRQQEKLQRPVARQANLKHQVNLRDNGQCTHKNSNGERCAQRRWIDLHHIVPRAMGGQDTIDNLITLCSGHHRLLHDH